MGDTHEKTLYIGIDPDVEKSGFAIWNKKLQCFHLIESVTLAKMVEVLQGLKPKIALVVIEAGFLNKGNRHTNTRQSIAAAAKTGENVGRNHQRALDIIELVEWIGIPYRLKKPTSKNSWKNDESMFQKITGTKGGNPEKRDAAMLVFKM
jgi:hypothetical protein